MTYLRPDAKSQVTVEYSDDGHPQRIVTIVVSTQHDDFEADEEGKLPADLKRGVLSEDAVYDLITEHRELMAGMQRAVLRCMEEKEF